MNAKTHQLLMQLEGALIAIEEKSETMLAQADSSIRTITEHIRDLKKLKESHTFSDTEEEIEFYKRWVPPFYAELVFYVDVYRLESHRRGVAEDRQRQLIADELMQASYLLEKHHAFSTYLEIGNTSYDELFFTRINGSPTFSPEDYAYLVADSPLLTPHSFLKARLRAAEKFISYLQSEQGLLVARSITQDADPIPLARWTGSLTAFTELVYGLKATGCINGGQADLKTIAEALARTFGVEGANVYRIFNEIRLRKTKNRVVFLSDMMTGVLRLMDEADERPSRF